MNINCFRCRKPINTPDNTNSDYVTANDMIEDGIQKTGIICPDCYKDTDFVIWGIHKMEG